LLLLTFSIALLSCVSHAKIVGYNGLKEDLSIEQKKIELENFQAMLPFVKDLSTMYSQFKYIRNIVANSSRETIEIMDILNTVNTTGICHSCVGFVDSVRKHTDTKVVQDILEKTAVVLCGIFENKTVCTEAVATFGGILITSLFEKNLNSSRICQKIAMCPRTIEPDYLKKYVKDVLADKPPTNYPTPTKKSTYTILQLADPHIDLEYDVGSDAFCNEPFCCRASNGHPTDPKKAAQYWGTMAPCDLPMRTFDQFLQFVSTNFDIDMIMWTGDNISHDVWHQSIANQTVNTFDATEEIIKYFPNTTVYPMFGNHEAYPGDQFDVVDNTTFWLTERLSGMWKMWLDDEALQTFRKKSYYSMVDKRFNVKIIALDTQACDSLNFYLIRDPSDPMHELEWLRNELYDSESKNQGVLIMAHIPPGDFNCDFEWSVRYRALVDRFTNIIRGQFFGHTHNDQIYTMRSFADDTPIGTQFVAPSFTTYSGLKPSFRIIELDAETHQPVNLYQYRLDLDKWNTNTTGPIAWDLAYDFLDEYDVPDMSFASVDSVSDKMKADPDVASLYALNFESGAGALTKLSKRETEHLYCTTKYGDSVSELKCLGLNAQVGELLYFASELLPGVWYHHKC